MNTPKTGQGLKTAYISYIHCYYYHYHHNYYCCCTTPLSTDMCSLLLPKQPYNDLMSESCRSVSAGTGSLSRNPPPPEPGSSKHHTLIICSPPLQSSLQVSLRWRCQKTLWAWPCWTLNALCRVTIAADSRSDP